MSEYNTQVVDIVNTILHEKFEVAKTALVPAANLKEDLNLDSLDFVDMFIMLEQKIGGDVQGVDFMKIRTLGDIYQMVGELKVRQPAN
jgi:acyl carrier protein